MKTKHGMSQKKPAKVSLPLGLQVIPRQYKSQKKARALIIMQTTIGNYNKVIMHIIPQYIFQACIFYMTLLSEIFPPFYDFTRENYACVK